MLISQLVDLNELEPVCLCRSNLSDWKNNIAYISSYESVHELLEGIENYLDFTVKIRLKQITGNLACMSKANFKSISHMKSI